MLGRMLDIDGGARRPEFLHIYSRSCGPTSQLYFSDINYKPHTTRIEAIGVDKNLQQICSSNNSGTYSFIPSIRPEWNPYPPALMPSSFPWPPAPGLEYFNKCRLEDVEYVTCCVNQEHAHRPIVGLMLHYHGGSRACVGQYRHDWVVEPVLVISDPESMPLVLTLYRDCEYGEYVKGAKGIYVMGVSVEGASVQSVDAISLDGRHECVWKTLRVPWYGWLEWWFSNFAHWNDRAFFHVAHVG